MNTHIHLKTLWCVAIWSAVAGILAFPAAAEMRSKPSRTIEMETYCFNAPPGDTWDTEIDRERDIVRFIEVRHPPGSSPAETPEGVTEILIAKRPVPASQQGLSEQEIANHYRDEEQRNMVRLGVSQKRYHLRNIEQGVVTIGGKTLYYMRYQAPTGSWVGLEGTSLDQHAVLYLYFPPGFTSD